MILNDLTASHVTGPTFATRYHCCTRVGGTVWEALW